MVDQTNPMNKPMHHPTELTYQELSTVLAALRLFQAQHSDDMSLPDIPDLSDYFSDVEPLTELEIDALCVKLTLGDEEDE